MERWLARQRAWDQTIGWSLLRKREGGRRSLSWEEKRRRSTWPFRKKKASEPGARPSAAVVSPPSRRRILVEQTPRASRIGPSPPAEPEHPIHSTKVSEHLTGVNIGYLDHFVLLARVKLPADTTNRNRKASEGSMQCSREYVSAVCRERESSYCSLGVHDALTCFAPI